MIAASPPSAPARDTRIIGVGAGGHARCVDRGDRLGGRPPGGRPDGRRRHPGGLARARPPGARPGTRSRPCGPRASRTRSWGSAASATWGRGARVAAALRAAGFRLPPIVHATAVIAASATLEEGAQVLAGAIVGPGRPDRPGRAGQRRRHHRPRRAGGRVRPRRVGGPGGRGRPGRRRRPRRHRGDRHPADLHRGRRPSWARARSCSRTSPPRARVGGIPARPLGVREPA